MSNRVLSVPAKFKIRLDCGINVAVAQEPRKSAIPLDRAALERLALHYAGRYATTRAKIRSYLLRKLQQRGWGEEGEPPVDAIVERMRDLGYVDDGAFAEMRAAGLTRRGYGVRRVDAALKAAGIAEPDARSAREAALGERWSAAIAFAKRKRFGPFAAQRAEGPAQRDKALSAFIRAGHGFEIARILVDCAPGEPPDAPE